MPEVLLSASPAPEAMLCGPRVHQMQAVVYTAQNLQGKWGCVLQGHLD